MTEGVTEGGTAGVTEGGTVGATVGGTVGVTDGAIVGARGGATAGYVRANPEQRERTALAWRRTGWSLASLGLALVKAGDLVGQAAVMVVALLASLLGALLVAEAQRELRSELAEDAALRRARRRGRFLRPNQRSPFLQLCLTVAGAAALATCGVLLALSH